ncbi:MAG: hypothetical protein ACK5O1_02050 [Holosporales bacterium]|jgi:hypothetical protein
MPYVARDSKGHIKAVYARRSPIAEERLAADAPELYRFFERTGKIQEARRKLEDSDPMMARILEDLISILVTKNIISYSELSEKAQRKLLQRKSLRWEMDNSNSDLSVANLDDIASLCGNDDERQFMDDLRRRFL